MRVILLSVMLLFTGCVSVPDKLVVLPELFPQQGARNVHVVINADNEVVNEGFGRYLIKALKARGVDGRLALMQI